MNDDIKLLFLLTGTGIVTYWFIQGLLNSFIEAAVSIVITGIFTVVSFFLTPFLKLGQAIMRFFDRIALPLKATFYLIIGCGVFVLDHYYNTKIFAEDQTTFYKIGIMEQTYWVTDIACWVGGLFLLLFGIIALKGIVKLFNYIFDRTIHISLLIYR
jgi:hypothetical protein